MENLWTRTPNTDTLQTLVTFHTVRAFRDRHADLVLLSLVRSQDQPVPYAEEAEDWRVALTAARSQLRVFGDPLALQRRTQAPVPPSRQTEKLAAMERVLLANLLRYMQRRHCLAPVEAVREGVLT